MAFDSFVLAAVSTELQQLLANAKINKIQQPDASTIVIRYHNMDGKGSLLLSAHPQNGRMHISSLNRENPAKAPLFAMVLRKWLEGARILRFSSTPGERVAQIELESRNELGDPVLLKLIIEIMGKHSNIILVNEQGIIIDGIRRYNSSLSRYREVLPGRPYIAPPPINKLPFPPASSEQLAAELYQEEGNSLTTALRKRVGGISPQLAEHICLSAGLQPQQSVDELGQGDFERIHRQICLLADMQQEQDYQPVLLCGTGNEDEYLDFYAFPLQMWHGQPCAYCHSMNEAVDRLYAAKEERQAVQNMRSRAAKQLRQHINRLNKKISLQQRDLEQSIAADSFKEAGDLLSANLFQLQNDYQQNRVSEIELPSFEDPQCLIKIKMDPALSAQENITRYYRRYSKGKHARSLIENQLNANQQELEYVESIEQALSDCSSRDEINEVEKEGIAAGYLRPVNADKAQKGKNSKSAGTAKTTALPPRRYRSSDGFTVLIGRNNKQNDRLSLRMAHPGDIWLHTQKIPGSHAIIISEGRQIPQSSIEEAATWAAWFSKARSSTQVPVDWLPTERLRKPAGARPGFVTYTGQKTIYVTPQNPGAEAMDAADKN